MKSVTMVTGNMGKWRIASDIFKKYNVELKQAKIETPEIQAYDVEEVSKYSAIYAAKYLNTSVIKSDVGYYIEALNGFPGVFLKYINNMLTSEEILKLMEDKKDRTIYLKECLSFATPEGKIKQFTNVEKATIYFKAMGNGSTFDKIVVFEEDKLPKSTNSEEKNFEHFKNQLQIYDEMAKYLERELKDEAESGV